MWTRATFTRRSMWTMTTSLDSLGAAPAETDTDASTRRVRAPLPDAVDVAIVGCGLGGLVAGANLARRGLKVALFDAHSVAGGCATHFARGPKAARYRFDVGLHYIGDCGPEGAIPRILRDVGIALDYAQ